MSNQDIHDTLDKLFEEIKTLAETDTEQAKQKLTIALNIMRAEFKKLKR